MTIRLAPDLSKKIDFDTTEHFLITIIMDGLKLKTKHDLEYFLAGISESELLEQYKK
jgi:hypothetical protein